jgi:hypothetical protein
MRMIRMSGAGITKNKNNRFQKSIQILLRYFISKLVST